MSSKPTDKIALPTLNVHQSPPGSDPICTAIGEALATWSALEVQLANVYLAVAHPNGFVLGAPAGFASVFSFEARVKIISYVLSFSLNEGIDKHKELLEKWGKLAGKLSNLNQKRNELAHGIPAKLDIDKYSGWTPYLNFSNFVLKYQKEWIAPKTVKELKVITLQTIRDREASFAKMFNALDGFIYDDVLPVTQKLEHISLHRLRLEDQDQNT